MLALHRTLFETFKCKSFYFVSARSLILNSFNANGSRNSINESVVICRHLFCSPPSLKRLGEVDADKKKNPDEQQKQPAKAKKEKQIYVTLIGTDNNITVCTLEEATKIAERRNLKLLKVKDFVAKTSRPEYKLMTSAQYLEDDRKQKEELKKKKNENLKGDKIVSISHKISEHDLLSKIKMMKKWLDKHYEVRIVISGDPGEASVSLFNKVFK